MTDEKRTEDETPRLELQPVPVTGFDVWIWAQQHDTWSHASCYSSYEDAMRYRPMAGNDGSVYKRKLFKVHIQFSQLEEFFEYRKSSVGGTGK